MINMAIGIVVVSLSIYVFAALRHYMFDPVEFDEPNVIIPTVTDSPSVVQLCRNMYFSRAVDFTITRAMTKQSGGGSMERSVDFGNTLIHREPGNVHQCRYIIIPDCIEPGEWTFHTFVTWQGWPHFTKTIEAPPVRLVIRRSECAG
jgi:hypothetical protein